MAPPVYLINYAQMRSSGSNLPSSGAGRAFLDPRAFDLADRTVRRYSGNCMTPVPLASKFGTDHELQVRCRRCPGCLRSRQYLWCLRAQLETFNSAKTLFFTGTFRAQPHDRTVASEEVTRYLYRLRSRLPYRIRYFVAFERHKSGAWHVHLLVHGPPEMTTRDIRRSWQAGYSSAAVCDVGASAYVTKYATKDLADRNQQRMPRVRASRNPRYGDAVMQHDAAVLAAMCNRPMDTRVEWAKNIRHLHQVLERSNRKEAHVWAQIAAMTSDLMTLDGQMVIDKTTGEILR